MISRLARVLVNLSVWLSLFGLIFLIYDKIAIQHVDYSNGIAFAREQWRQIGEDREGKASSVWSAAGYLIGSAYYVIVVLIITQLEELKQNARIRFAVVAFLFLLANSLITGGRSNFLLLAVIAMGAFSARAGLGINKVFKGRRHRKMAYGLFAVSVFYMFYVFFARAHNGDLIIFQYVIGFLPWEGLAFDDWYTRTVNEGWLGSLSNVTVLVLSYLSHSYATCAAIMDAPHEDKTMIFYNVTSLLYKVGLAARPDGDWFAAGKLPSVPGALWHEFGALPFAISSLFLGVLGGVVKLWVVARPRLLLPLAAYVLVYGTFILTPYEFAPDFLSFPFVVSAFVLLAFVSRFRLRSLRLFYITPGTLGPDLAGSVQPRNVVQAPKQELHG